MLAIIKTWHEHDDYITIKWGRSLLFNIIEAARCLARMPVTSPFDYTNLGGITVVSKSVVVDAKMVLKLKVRTFEYFCCYDVFEGGSTVFVAICPSIQD